MLATATVIIAPICITFLHLRQVTAFQFDRRSAIIEAVETFGIGSAAAAFPEATLATQSSKTPIADRLHALSLTMPPPSQANELNGVDNFYFPPWLEGEWEVVQTLRSAETPLGLKFLGGPRGSDSIAYKSMEEQRLQIGVPIKLRLRYVPTKWGVAEDRLFNTRQRLDAFAGRSVVASVEYANVGGSNRASILALGGKEDDPLQTTLVLFKGPAAQKVFMLSHGEEFDPKSSDKWAGYEVLRSIFALTNQNTAPPVTTDTESIWGFERIDNDHVNGRLRIASYLNAQSDMLYFDARNNAVSLADYSLNLTRVR